MTGLDGYREIKKRHTLARSKDTDDGKQRFELVRFANITLRNLRRYLVKGLIPRDGLIIIWGPPKCGKSFWISDLALHIGLGREYRGRRVERGLVIYITCEGQSGFPARIEAFRRLKLNGDAEPLFRLVSTRLDFIDDIDQLVTDIKAQLGETAPVLIVIDTLNRSLVGSESKDEDMAEYIRSCDQLREVFSCAVAVVHHCGIEASRPRGHTSLTGAADAQIAIKRDREKNIVATVEFMKDGQEGDEVVSVLTTVDIGTDEDGEPLTSCVVEAADGHRPSVKTEKKKLPETAKAGLDQLKNCLADHVTDVPFFNHVKPGTKGGLLDLWRKYLVKAGVINEDGSPREQFRRIRVTLQERGYIGVWEDYVWICQ